MGTQPLPQKTPYFPIPFAVRACRAADLFQRPGRRGPTGGAAKQARRKPGGGVRKIGGASSGARLDTSFLAPDITSSPNVLTIACESGTDGKWMQNENSQIGLGLKMLGVRFEGCREGQFRNWNYRIEDRAGRVWYCGFTTNPRQRVGQHHRGTNGLIHKRMRKIGRDQFTVVFHDGDNTATTWAAQLREQEYIRRHGTSVTDNPDNPIASNISKQVIPSLKDQPRGRQEEIKRKIGTAHRGKKLSPQHIETIRRAMTGRSPSRESRAKMSAAKKGTTKTVRQRLNMSIKSSWNKPVRFGNIDFRSQAEAARYWNVPTTTLSRWIREGYDRIPPRTNGPGRPRRASGPRAIA